MFNIPQAHVSLPGNTWRLETYGTPSQANAEYTNVGYTISTTGIADPSMVSGGSVQVTSLTCADGSVGVGGSSSSTSGPSTGTGATTGTGTGTGATTGTDPTSSTTGSSCSSTFVVTNKQVNSWRSNDQNGNELFYVQVDAVITNTGPATLTRAELVTPLGGAIVNHWNIIPVGGACQPSQASSTCYFETPDYFNLAPGQSFTAGLIFATLSGLPDVSGVTLTRPSCPSSTADGTSTTGGASTGLPSSSSSSTTGACIDGVCGDFSDSSSSETPKQSCSFLSLSQTVTGTFQYEYQRGPDLTVQDTAAHVNVTIRNAGPAIISNITLATHTYAPVRSPYNYAVCDWSSEIVLVSERNIYADMWLALSPSRPALLPGQLLTFQYDSYSNRPGEAALFDFRDFTVGGTTSLTVCSEYRPF
eukprot:TRINITY_DN5131_c0_g1_i4.p1 TRINITY_DN5131_c0_g1~~TRINITY_DN5131_c0_g1_i4.p1  ORF type:complete len:418 (-),score=97.45 TRINITY_DN5131_c0_g1_i4:69-1322(-)